MSIFNNNLPQRWGLTICKGGYMLVTTRNKQLFSVTHSNRCVGMEKINQWWDIKGLKIFIQVLSLILQIEKLISIILNNWNRDPSETALLKQNCRYLKSIVISPINDWFLKWLCGLLGVLCHIKEFFIHIQARYEVG